MRNLTYNGIEYDILYIDPSIENSGDGSTPVNALKDIPSSLENNDENPKCYIIRRCSDDEVYYVNMPQSWDEKIYQIIFLGMPTNDSPWYDLMETDAKELWGSDMGKWARIRCNSGTLPNYYSYDIDSSDNKTLFKNKTLTSFIANNCYFYRDSDSGDCNNYGNNLTYMFAFNDTSKKLTISFDNCKFGYTQYNLENDEVIDGNTDISFDTTHYPQFKCKGYVLIRSANNVSFSNCIINHVFNRFYEYDSKYREYYTAYNKVIYIGNYNKLIFKDNQYNILYRKNETNNPSNDTSNYIYSGIYSPNSSSGEFIISNIKINKIFTPNDSIYGSTDIYIIGNKGSVENVDYKYKVMGSDVGGGLLNNVEYIIPNTSLDIHGFNSLYVNNINCNYENTKINSLKLISLGSLRVNSGNINSKIENINVKFSNGDGYDFGSPILRIYGDSDEYINPSTTSNNSYNYIQNSSKTWIADNIIIDAPKLSNTALELIRCGCKAQYIRGKVVLRSATLDVDKIYNNYPTTPGISILNPSDGNTTKFYCNSYLKCNEYIADINQKTYTGQIQMDMSYDSLSSVYIGKTNAIIFNEIPTGNQYRGSINGSFVCPNYILNGQFFGRNANVFVKSWNTKRTNSLANGSLRFNNNYCNDDSYKNPFVVGEKPYKGISVNPSTTGKKILTAFIGYKNFDDNEIQTLSDNVGIHVYCPETKLFNNDPEKSYNVNHFYSSEGMGWKLIPSDDPSNDGSWQGSNYIKTLRVDIPIEVFDTNNPIDVKIWYNIYSPNGVVFVDPDFKLTDVE